MERNNGTNPNIAASWPIIVNEQALNEASILPQLLHEASEEALQQATVAETSQSNGGRENDGGGTDGANNSEEQLQQMIENYSKHVIRQKQQQQSKKGSASNATMGTGRSASHLQRKINAPMPTPMSHSHPCLFSDGGTRVVDEQSKSSRASSALVQPQMPNLHSQHNSDPREVQQLPPPPPPPIPNGGSQNWQHMNGQQQRYEPQQVDQPQNLLANENAQLRQKLERLQRKCDKLELLESAYRKIERDYEQMLGQQERREELSRSALQKLEQQVRMLSTENEQLRAQSAKLGHIFMREGDGEQQIHFLLNELIPKNNELLLIKERQCMELEAQSATLEEQRTHIDVLEKALSNAQERLAAKERSAVDAVAVVDKCTHLQRMLQEALEDKQRQKEQHRRQVAQLEMELTQLRLQHAKENNSQSAIGSLGRKGGAIAAAGGSPEVADEMLKMRKALAQKEERISQLEQSLLQLQDGRFGDEESVIAKSGGGRMADSETRMMQLELEKAEKERRIQELLDEKMRIHMQWTEERRSLDMRVRLLEKDLRHFMGSQSSLASSVGGGGMFPPDLAVADPHSPFASIRGQKSASYNRHRSTAELPTSARGAALYDERLDVMARMEELGRKLAERRAKATATGERTTTVQRPSDLGLAQLGTEQEALSGTFSQSRTSSSEQPLQQQPMQDMSPGSEEHQLPTNGGMPLQRQSAPSSTGSSSKKRYLVNAPPSQLNAYLEQLPEATRRRLTGEKLGAGGFHLLAGIERNNGGGGRREGGCRRLIRDHSVEKTTARKTALPAGEQMPPPPAYMDSAPPSYQSQTSSSVSHQQQLRQLHQMSSIEEPMQEPPAPPGYSAKTVNVVEVHAEEGGGDSDTLTGHQKIVMRRSSLGNANVITK